MNAVRYYLAILLLSFTPPAFIFWLSIHPFIRFWRGLGLGLALGINYAGLFLLAALIFMFCKPLLSVDFGTNPVLIGIGVPLLIVSGAMHKRLSKHLRLSILTGIPELAPERNATPLLTEGIYSRIRHPRYVQVFLGIVAYTLICNYLATYLLLLAVLVVILLLVPLEERELRQRFGAEYEVYSTRVPRFIPKFRG
jgi:protein-S-isoprenylcysteine O-methyltransferase Ste14